MKYIFYLLTLLFLPVLSYKEIKPKLCINCKYFIAHNNDNKFGKCSLFQKEENNIYKLIDGTSLPNAYHYCSVTRGNEDMCGKEGKMYKRKYVKKST